tara:strand:+ start:95 stop:700 length:606 start_codon:yes stop_codon:yes gene_type:complete
MGVLSAAARAAMKARKAAAAAAKAAAKLKKNAGKGDLDVDTLVKAQVAKAKKSRAKPKANAKAKAKAKDSGDISEVVMRKDRKPSTTERQTSKERLTEATGSISAGTTKAGSKPLAMSAYRSMSSAKRSAALLKADIDFRAGRITKTERAEIVKRIRQSNASEVDKSGRQMAQGKSNKKAKPVSLAPDMKFSKGGYTKGKK